MKPSQYIYEAAKVIERGWTQGAPARNIHNLPTSALNGEACSWCAIGALRKVSDTRLHDKVAAVLGLPLTPIGALHPLAEFNDARGRTKEEVITKLCEAASLLEARGE